MTELTVRQWDYRAIPCCTYWPARPTLPTFTHLHTLHIDDFYSPLPPAAMLPSLKHLYVRFTGPKDDAQPYSDRVQSTEDKCESIGRFLPQLVTLSIPRSGTRVTHLYWPLIFSQQITTLERFATEHLQLPEALPLLMQHAPSVRHVSFDTWNVHTSMAHTKWGVTHFAVLGRQGRVCATELVKLPVSPGVLTIEPGSGRAKIIIEFVVASQEVSHSNHMHVAALVCIRMKRVSKFVAS